MSINDVIFEARGISKIFGPTHANREVNLQLKRGEVHALAGENGSGKSTLISIICGLYSQDGGEMFIHGQPYNPAGPIDANNKKIGFVVQELGLVDDLQIGINMFLGHMEEYKRFGIIKTGKLFYNAEKELKKLGFNNVSTVVKAKDLSVEKRKLVEITKALFSEPDILILDETTQALSHDMRLKLYEIIHEQKKKGTAILIVTHDLEEMVELADTVTVLRDGAVAGNLAGEEMTVDAVRKMMVGRQVGGEYYRSDRECSYHDDIALEVKNLSMDGAFSDVSFELHNGEILALCGLSDAGIHELGKALAGIEKTSKGTVHVVKNNTYIKKPLDAIKVGMAYVPKDRDREALMMGTTIYANLILPSIREMANKLGFVSPSKLRNLADEASRKFNVRCLGIDQNISALSGGNKQKISIGRWLIKDLNILIMDCPTRGVDVSVKAYIYGLMKELKDQGLAMILIADEMTEAIGMADRLIVLKNGRVSSVLDRNEELNESKVIEVMI